MATPKEASHYLMVIGIAVFLVLTLGCQSTPSPAEPCPKWVKSIPTDNTYYYAVGVSGPRPRVPKMIEQASERARAELGRMIVSHVTSKGTHSISSSGQYAEEIVRVLSDTELNLTEVTEMWHDSAGSCGPPNHFYVLVRIKKTFAETILRGIKQMDSRKE
jgi:hypothetical protein